MHTIICILICILDISTGLFVVIAVIVTLVIVATLIIMVFTVWLMKKKQMKIFDINRYV